MQTLNVHRYLSHSTKADCTYRRHGSPPYSIQAVPTHKCQITFLSHLRTNDSCCHRAFFLSLLRNVLCSERVFNNQNTKVNRFVVFNYQIEKKFASCVEFRAKIKMGKLNVSILRYLTKEDFRVLTAVSVSCIFGLFVGTCRVYRFTAI